MGVWKVGVSLRIREDLREEMMGFAKSEKRSFGNLGAVLLEWSVEKLKAAGGTSELFGSYSKRLNNVTRDRRKRRAGGLRWANGKHS